jgi:CDGSH-type Zn-finger protein
MLIRGSQNAVKKGPFRAVTRAFSGAADIAEEVEDLEHKRLGSLWTNVWFPYEPVPVSPQLAPYIVKVEGGHGEAYEWCSCGESMTQPWADGKCKCSKCVGGWSSTKYMPRRDGYKLLCGCKMCVNRPKYDGTCTVVWFDHNPVMGSAMIFGGGFTLATLVTYLFHP